MRRRGRGALLVLAWLLWAAPAAAQPTQAPTPTPAPAPAAQPAAPDGETAAAPEDPVQAIRGKLAQLEKERAELASRSAAGETPAGAAEELELIAALERTYEDQLAALTRRQELAEARQALEERLAAGPAGSISATPPFELAVLDAVEDARDAQQQHGETVRSALKAANAALESAEDALEQAEHERRLARDDAAAETDPVRAAQLRVAQRLAELRAQVARATREGALLERDNLRTEADLQKQTDQLLADTVVWVRQRVRVDDDALREPLRKIDEREFETTRVLERTERELRAAESRLDLVERRVAATPQPPPELVAELETRRLEQQVLARRAASLSERSKQLDADRTLWKRRRAVLAGSADRDDLAEWTHDVGARLEDARRSARLGEARLSELRQEASGATENAKQLAAANSPVAPWEARRARLLDEMASLYEQELTEGREEQKLARRVLEDLRSRSASLTWSERVGSAVESVEDVWDTEIFTVEDQAITVGKITGALLVFVIGLALSSLITRLIKRLLRQRLEEGAASAIQGLLFYLLVALTFLLALRTVNIPLTAFAILGGALAIGVGFGSQNVVNNFISGLILLAERPIKVGDLVEVASVMGHVERIGARSTRVRTFSNTHLIIPNSYFLEQEVVNWTLSDDDIRTQIEVGVVYGSPTREVDRLLRRAMTEHGKVMKTPEPAVWFTGFGDNALEFRALYWVRSRQMGERLAIESDIRFRIDNLFREAGIVIAFPQRDVHLDSTRPIEVRMLPPEGGEASREPSE